MGKIANNHEFSDSKRTFECLIPKSLVFHIQDSDGSIETWGKNLVTLAFDAGYGLGMFLVGESIQVPLNKYGSILVSNTKPVPVVTEKGCNPGSWGFKRYEFIDLRAQLDPSIFNHLLFSVLVDFL